MAEQNGETVKVAEGQSIRFVWWLLFPMTLYGFLSVLGPARNLELYGICVIIGMIIGALAPGMIKGKTKD
jgi:hypothetical protein